MQREKRIQEGIQDRVELAKQRDEEKELIMETKTEDMRLFHKLVRTNRKKGNDVIVDLNVNC
jgi:hypothetical protein